MQHFFTLLSPTEGWGRSFVLTCWVVSRGDTPSAHAGLGARAWSMFDPDEIRAACVLGQRPLPAVPPRLNEVVRRVAMLGGFLARKGDGEPGVKTIWIGLQRIVDFAAGVRFMRESDDGTSCV